MIFCPECNAETEPVEDYEQGFSYCQNCGSVLEEGTYQVDVQYNEEGERVGTVYNVEKDAQEPALFGPSEKGEREITLIVDNLKIYPRKNMIDCSGRLYSMAVHRGFLRGRCANQVAACCIYIMCRHDKKPYMLVDFSDILNINVYALATVFMDITMLFSLDVHPIITAPVDPCLYIHRYVDKINFGEKTPSVIKTSIQLIKSMNREWLQTGRKPAGIIAAAIYLASHLHGVPKLRHDIVNVMHIGVITVGKRLTEFSKTKTARLTPEEFDLEAKKYQELEDAEMANDTEAQSEVQAEKAETQAEEQKTKFTCHHIKTKKDEFLKGMCKDCYVAYISLSGGNYTGFNNPPCFKKPARKKRYKSLSKILQLIKRYEEYEEEDRHSSSSMIGEEECESNVGDIDREMLEALSSDQLQDLARSLNLSPSEVPHLLKKVKRNQAKERARIERERIQSAPIEECAPIEISSLEGGSASVEGPRHEKRKSGDEEDNVSENLSKKSKVASEAAASSELIPFDESDEDDIIEVNEMMTNEPIEVTSEINSQEVIEVPSGEHEIQAVAEQQRTGSEEGEIQVIGEEESVREINLLNDGDESILISNKTGSPVVDTPLAEVSGVTASESIRAPSSRRGESEQIPFDTSEDDVEALDQGGSVSAPEKNKDKNGGDSQSPEIEEEEFLVSEEDEDVEIQKYIRNSDEAEEKSNSWKSLHKDYLEKIKNRPKPQEKKGRKRKAKEKIIAPIKRHDSLYEAVKEALEQRGLHKQINYKNLQRLLSEEPRSPSPPPKPKTKQQLQYEREMEARHLVGLNAERRGPKGLDGEFLSHLSFRKHLPKKNPNRLQGLYS